MHSLHRCAASGHRSGLPARAAPAKGAAGNRLRAGHVRSAVEYQPQDSKNSLESCVCLVSESMEGMNP